MVTINVEGQMLLWEDYSEGGDELVPLGENFRDKIGSIWHRVTATTANIKTFETEEETIRLANDTRLTSNLTAAVCTESVSRAPRVASKINAGTVGINPFAFSYHITPFDGYMQSRTGRELGKAGLLAYFQEKTISINMGV